MPPPNEGSMVVSVSICADVHLYAMLMTQSMSLQVYRVDVENHTATTMFFPGSFSGENTVGRDPISSFIRRTLSAAGRAREYVHCIYVHLVEMNMQAAS